MKIIFSILSILFVFSGKAQEDTLWTKISSLKVSVDTWGVDPNENVIYAQGDALVRLDTTFKEQFRQSKKDFGDITTIDARQSQKTLLFSEEQQQITFVDNTLTPVTAPIDLSQKDVFLATHVSYSNLSQRYWVYDQDNFRILLFDERRKEPTIIENLNGILGEFQLDQFFEFNNQLYVIDFQKGIYMFDIYGSLVNTLKIEDVLDVAVNETYIFLLKKDAIIKKNQKSGESIELPLPCQDINRIQIFGNHLFIQTETHLEKYSVFLN